MSPSKHFQRKSLKQVSFVDIDRQDRQKPMMKMAKDDECDDMKMMSVMTWR